MSGKMCSGDADIAAGIQHNRVCLIAYLQPRGHFDSGFHILIGGEWKL